MRGGLGKWGQRGGLGSPGAVCNTGPDRIIACEKHSEQKSDELDATSQESSSGADPNDLEKLPQTSSASVTDLGYLGIITHFAKVLQ